MTTEERLLEIQNRADRATVGPWEWQEDNDASCGGYCTVDGCQENHFSGTYSLYGPETGDTSMLEFPKQADAEFLANAREDIPFLLREIKRLQEANQTLENAYRISRKAQIRLIARARAKGVEVADLQLFGGGAKNIEIIPIGRLHVKYAKISNPCEWPDIVRVEGRVDDLRSTRIFFNLKDETGTVQLFCHKDNLSKLELVGLTKIEEGDPLSVTGYVARTSRDTLSIKVTGVQFRHD